MSGSQGFCIWLFQVVIVLGLLVFFLWLALRPVDPTYTVVEFSLPGHNNATDAQLGLEISNSNRDGGVRYDDIAIDLYLDDDSVGGATIPSFYQPHGHTTDWRGRLRKRGGRGRWGGVIRAVANGTADLRVGLVTAVRYRVWGVRSKAHPMDMQAVLPLGADGRFSGKGRVKMHRARRRWRLRR